MGDDILNGAELLSVSKPIYRGNFDYGHIITSSSPSHAERIASLKTEVDAMAEKYKPVIDKLMDEIYESSQKPIELLSEGTVQQITKAFENRQKTMEKGFPIVFAKPAKRKHYKPKFTL